MNELTKVDSVAEWLDSLDKYNHPTHPGDEESIGNIQKWEVLELVRMARYYKMFCEASKEV